MRNMLVTGASQGIGLAIAEGLLRHGDAITLVARASNRLQTTFARLSATYGQERVQAEACDLSCLAEVRALAERLPACDGLVSNAALMPAERRLTPEGFDETLAVNHLAPFVLVNALIPKITRGGRIIIVGADPVMLAREPVDLDDLACERQWSQARAYMRSKNMNAMFAYTVARRLMPQGISVNAAHPGVIRTALGRDAKGWMRLALGLARPFLPDAETGADTPLWLATAPELDGVTGRFFVKRREVRTADHTLDIHRQELLWQASDRLVQGIG